MVVPDEVGEQLASWGRVALLETRGRRTGELRRVAVGFVEGFDGTLVVAAGHPSTAWALNLLADPRCRVAVGGRSFQAIAEPLAGEDHAGAVRELILKYGTPSEGLGRGPSFRLVPGEPDGDV